MQPNPPNVWRDGIVLRGAMHEQQNHGHVGNELGRLGIGGLSQDRSISTPPLAIGQNEKQCQLKAHGQGAYRRCAPTTEKRERQGACRQLESPVAAQHSNKEPRLKKQHLIFRCNYPSRCIADATLLTTYW